MKQFLSPITMMAFIAVPTATADPIDAADGAFGCVEDAAWLADQ